MKIAIFGMGYVGCVNAVLLAQRGHDVTGVEISKSKLQLLLENRLPIFEPGLNEVFSQLDKNKIRFTSNIDALDQDTDVIFICVGTPALTSGGVDLSYIANTCAEITTFIKESSKELSVFVRSTIPPGTSEKVILPQLKKSGKEFSYYYYPEFLREGNGVADFNNPSLNIVGCDAGDDISIIENLFLNNIPVQKSTIKSAEFIKYVNNSFHALKVTFANEIGSVANQLGVDSNEVMNLFVQDTKLNISSAYFKPGAPYGGPCLGKDVRALAHFGKKLNLELPLIEGIGVSNESHLKRVVNEIENSGIKKWLVMGVTFKPGTDDIRQSPVKSILNSFKTQSSYKECYQFYISESNEIFNKTAAELSGLNLIEALIPMNANQVEGIILGPKILTEDDCKELNDFEGIILDLGFQETKIEVMCHPGYRKIY